LIFKRLSCPPSPLGAEGFFPGWKNVSGVKLTTHFHIEPMLKSGTLLLCPPYVFTACTGTFVTPTGKDQLYVVTDSVDLCRVKDRFIGERRIGNYVEGKDRLVLEARFLEGVIQSERCQDWSLSRLMFEPDISRNSTVLPLTPNCIYFFFLKEVAI